MTDIEKIIKEVSRNLGEDEEIVACVTKHVFKCIEETMKDDEDTRDILLNNLMKFKLKRRYKEDKTKQYSSK